MTTTTFETAKVGDKVYSPTFGWGEISSIREHSDYPINVHFRNYTVYKTFTIKGHFYADSAVQSLFWNYVHIEAPTKPIVVKVIHGIEVPDITFRPKLNEYYYTPMPTHPELHHLMNYCSNVINNHLRDSNLCYPFTEEGKQAAILHAKAMLGISQ
ncbi:MAG: hypothetical protein JHC33_09660 [Ignisphaera sp.]|nr:hypothetical protein [Ignisphaera sp.]